jgi:integrase
VLSPADVERLTSAMHRRDDQLLIRVLAYTGLRIGEALALRRADIDLKRRLMTVRESVREVDGHLLVSPTKTSAVRAVTLPDSLCAALGQRLDGLSADPRTVVFGNSRGGHRRYRIWRRDSWDPAARAADIKATPHDLRATCASLLIDAGASVKDVQQQLGHADVTTTLKLYARVRPGRSDDLAERLDRLILEGAAGSSGEMSNGPPGLHRRRTGR